MNPLEQLADHFAALALVAMLAGCATPLVVKKDEATCTVPAIVVEAVDSPAKLAAGARNEDMKTRMDALEGALSICNARLADVPQALQRGTPKPEALPAAPSWTDRFLGIFRRSP